MSAFAPPLAASAARSHTYAVLSRAFVAPAPGRAPADLPECELARALHALPEAHDRPRLLELWRRVCRRASQSPPADIEAEYLRLFEVGIPRAPVPLYESAYGKKDRRREVMAELVRFYNHFGLRVGTDAQELPDHLSIELEFLHVLTFLETQAAQAGQPVDGLLRAQRDLYARHLARWTPLLWSRLGDAGSDVFAAWAAFARSYMTAESAFLQEVS